MKGTKYIKKIHQDNELLDTKEWINFYEEKTTTTTTNTSFLKFTFVIILFLYYETVQFYYVNSCKSQAAKKIYYKSYFNEITFFLCLC